MSYIGRHIEALQYCEPKFRIFRYLYLVLIIEYLISVLIISKTNKRSKVLR